MNNTNEPSKEMEFGKKDILKILEEHQELNSAGICFPKGLSEWDKNNRISYFLSSTTVQKLEFIYNWLKQVKKIKTINYRSSSYGLKHIVERAEGCPGRHIYNGDFIMGALLSGFEMKGPRYIEPYFPNVYFNISERSLKNTAAYREMYHR